MPENNPPSLDLTSLRDRAAALVSEALRAGADAADTVVAHSRASGVEIRDGAVEETESAENTAFTLRAFVGKRSAAISANQVDDIAALAVRAVAMAKVSPEDPETGLADTPMLADDVEDLDLFDETALSFEEMADRAAACEEAALGVPGVTKSSGASFGHALGGMVLATSHGFCGSYRTSRFSLSASVVAGEDDKMVRDYDFDSQRHFSDLRGATTIGREAGERASRRARPRVPETQTATVVFEPRVARSLVSHLAGAVTGSAVVRNTSFLREDMGQRLFREGVKIVDEPRLPRGVASRPFDGEGVFTADLDLISDGKLRNWLLDSRSARKLGLASNGRASRAGSSTAPSATNLTLQPGDLTLRALFDTVRNGLFVTELIGQGANLVTGDYSRGASGFLIENGEITQPVSEFTIAGTLRAMFSSLVAADDLEKRYAVNAPTVAIEGMTIAGR